MHRPGDITVSYQWGFKGLFPVAEAKGIDYQTLFDRTLPYYVKIERGTYQADALWSVISKQGDVHVTTIGWDLKHGPTAMVTPDGNQTSFTYDAAGRLREIYDNDNDLIGAYHYNYGSTSAVSEPVGGFSMTRNFVASFNPRIPGVSLGQLLTLPDPETAIITVKYYDAFGREAQTVALSGSQGKDDQVVATLYNNNGKPEISTLPFTNNGNGSFVDDPLSAVMASSIYNGDDPFTRTLFETSPTGRPVEQGNAGKNFQPGSGHTLKTEYLI